MVIGNFIGKVTKKEYLTEDVILLSLDVPREFTFKAGQFITIIFEKDGDKKPRSYSILSSPSEEGKLDLCIKIVEGGFASEIFSEFKEKDQLNFKGPLGHFIFDKDDKNEEIWMIAGGTGVAPFYSMLKEYLSNTGKKFTLIFGVRSKKDLFLHKELSNLAENNENLIYIPTLTREEWNGKKGRVHEHLPQEFKNKTFYICGLKELVLETKEILERNDVKKENIKFERYS